MLVKSRVLLHDSAASFWYEARPRTLLVGRYCPNNAGARGSPRGWALGGSTLLFDDLKSELSDLDVSTRGVATAF